MVFPAPLFVPMATEAVASEGGSVEDQQWSGEPLERGHLQTSCEKNKGSILRETLEGFSRDEAIRRIYVWASV